MPKSRVIALVVYVVVAAGFLFVALNAHMDIYPCEVREYSFQTRRHSYPRSSTCSLLKIKRSGESPSDDLAKLSAGGWIVLFLVHSLVPVPVALGAGWLMRKKE